MGQAYQKFARFSSKTLIASKGEPNLGKIAKLARAFGLGAWHLIHPTMGDGEFTAQELAPYRKLKATITSEESEPRH